MAFSALEERELHKANALPPVRKGSFVVGSARTAEAGKAGARQACARPVRVNNGPPHTVEGSGGCPRRPWFGSRNDIVPGSKRFQRSFTWFRLTRRAEGVNQKSARM